MASNPRQFAALLERIIKGEYKESALDLSGSELNDDDAIDLVRALKINPHITSVNLNNNLIGNKGAAVFATIPHLQALYLANNKDIDFNGFFPYVENKNLKILDLSGVIIEGDDAVKLAQNRSLEVLILNNCHLGHTAVKAFAANTTLKSLSIVGTNMTNKKAKYLAANTTLTHLDLSVTDLSDKGARRFLHNSNLTSIILNKNPRISAKTLLLIEEKLRQNKQNALDWQKVALVSAFYKANQNNFVEFIFELIKSNSITSFSTSLDTEAEVKEHAERKGVNTQRFVDTQFLQHHVKKDFKVDSDVEYQEFKRRYLSDFHKDTVGRVKTCFGLAPKLDFDLYTTFESVKRYAKLHPNDRSMKILKEMAEERNKAIAEAKQSVAPR